MVPGYSDSKQRSPDLQALQSLVRERCYSAGVPDKILAAAGSLFELLADRHRGALRAEPVPYAVA